MIEETEDAQARATLNRYYHSECTVHGGYILSVVVALFAFLQFLTPFKESIPQPYFFISIILSIFITAIWFLVVRTILWGTLASFILHTKKLSVCDTIKKLENKEHVLGDNDQITTYIRFHFACFNRFEERHKKIQYFSASKGGILSYRYYFYFPFFLTVYILIVFLIGIIFGINAFPVNI